MLWYWRYWVGVNRINGFFELLDLLNCFADIVVVDEAVLDTANLTLLLRLFLLFPCSYILFGFMLCCSWSVLTGAPILVSIFDLHLWFGAGVLLLDFDLQSVINLISTNGRCCWSFLHVFAPSMP